MKVKSARAAAVRALMRQEQDGYSNLVLQAALKKEQLSPRDAAFASQLFYGVLERRSLLDWRLAQCSARPLQKLDAAVLAILRSGLYQLCYLRTPPSAAVNEAVRLTRVFGKSSAAGFVNAVLRRAPAADPAKAQFASEPERLAVLCSVSLPVAKLFYDTFGGEAQAILEAFWQPQPTALRPNLLRTSAAALARALAQEGVQDIRPGAVPGSLLARFAGSPAASPRFAAGEYTVQGQASQLAALALDARPGQKVVDLCAAPGGKSLLLAQQMANTGQLFSCDVTPNRVSLIEKTFARCGIANAQTLCQDASLPDPRLAGADRVLCDVPCSGLGVLGKKPDIRYKNLESLNELTALQGAILRQGAAYLAPGGRLVYSTCTLNPAENAGVVGDFLREHPEFHPVPPPFVPQGARFEGEMLTILPTTAGFDGFFVACLERL